MTLKIVDTHQHLWELDKLNLEWLEGIPELNRSFTNEDYLAFTGQTEESEFSYEISQTIYMEVDVCEADIDKETNLVLELCRDSAFPLVGMIAAARPESTNFERTLEFAQSNPEIKGFRRVLHTDSTPAGTCLSSSFVSSLKTPGKLRVNF